MKTIKIISILLFVTGVLWACKKEANETPAPLPPPAPGQTALLQVFANNVTNARQSFTVNAASGAQMMAAQGTRLQFAPGAFLHLDGTPVTGQVDVSVVEVLDIGDMIWLNKQTVGNDNGNLRLLRSGGAINVRATQGGNTLRVTQGGLFVQIPTDVGDPAMQLFMGNEAADGTLIWDPIDSSGVTVVEEYFNVFYAFPMDSLTWINCDYFPSLSLTPLMVTVPEGQTLNNTYVWIALPSENAVMGMTYSAPQIFTSSWGGVPLNMQAVIVGLHHNANGYYSSFNPVTITSNMSVPLIFTETTLEQFQSDVNGL